MTSNELGAVRILSCFPINLSNTCLYSFSYVLLRLIGKHDRIRTAPNSLEVIAGSFFGLI